MMIPVIGLLGIIFSLIVGPLNDATAVNNETAPVVLELFTSEGCSSCPPADELLSELGAQGDPNIIPLAYHVDYWDYIGWTDPYGQKTFTDRQYDYVNTMNLESAYTPQVVVQGRYECVGSNRTKISELIKKARSEKHDVTLQLSWTDETHTSVTVDAAAGAKLPSSDIWLAVYENNLMSSVLRGENRGRELYHNHVVRKLTKISKIKADKPVNITLELPIEKNWKPQNIGVVVFVQNSSDRAIYAASALKK